MNGHLDSDSIDRYLAGEQSPAAETHLRECAQCRAAVGTVETALAQFRNAVKQAGGLCARPVPASFWTVSDQRRNGLPIPIRWAAVAAVAIVIAVVPFYRNYAERRAAAQVQADTVLLQEISTDLSRPAPEPLEPLIELVSQ